MRVLVIHHEDWKLYLLRASSRQKHNNLGAFEAVLRDAGYAVDYHESATGHPLRATMDRYSHIICLGGNMAADEDEKHAFLREEMRHEDNLINARLSWLVNSQSFESPLMTIPRFLPL